MYLFELNYWNACHNGSGSLRFTTGQDGLCKWNFIHFTDTEKDLELLKLTALACIGCTEHLKHLPCDLSALIHVQAQSVQLETIWEEHYATGDAVLVKPRKRSGLRINSQGKGVRLGHKDRRFSNQEIPYAHFSRWSHPARHPVFAYGAAPRAHIGSDDFDFSDPFYQLKRIHSLFSEKAPITDPVAFLRHLHYRGVGYGRFMPAQILKTLQRLLSKHLGAETEGWVDRNVNFSEQWAKISPVQQQLLLPVLDAARHLHDALPSYGNPLNFPGIMLLYRPDCYCPPEYFPDWMDLLDQLFPAMQFIVSVPESSKGLLPHTLLSKKVPQFPKDSGKPQKSLSPAPFKAASLRARTMLLVEVDGRLPNLALMKLAGYYKRKGYHIRLAKGEAYEPGVEAVFASSIFKFPPSMRRVEKMRHYYGDAFHCGGSGIDLVKRLPGEIEAAEPDYGIYPELQDRAIGFLTRGCPFTCSFCIVPLKEGRPRQVSDIESLVGTEKSKLILLDDNILSHPDSNKLLQEMAAKKLRVNFNQTLDLSLVDEMKAKLIRAIPCSNVKFTRTVYHFSLNDARNLSGLRKKYELFNFSTRDNVEFICMYGFNTTLAQDLERFRFLHSLPGAYVFVQEYKPYLGGPKPQLDSFFADQYQSDRLIDELIGICFTQNMKSMEKYYRWLSKLYAEHFGTVHMGLVDTIFRYNQRFKRGRYIASLAGTIRID